MCNECRVLSMAENKILFIVLFVENEQIKSMIYVVWYTKNLCVVFDPQKKFSLHKNYSRKGHKSWVCLGILSIT